jgi:AmmeMemoRadiSam system protein B
VAQASSRPRLRPIELIAVPDRRLGKALMLRDTQGVATSHAVLPLELAPVVGRMNGARTCEQIARDASRELGEEISTELVVRIATELEDALFVEGAPYQRARERVEKAFADADVRPASHAGGAYHDDPGELAKYIERDCFAAAAGANGANAANGTNGTNRATDGGGDAQTGDLIALVAPHIDPWRGARGYGEAYGVLGRALPAHVDTFVVFGTSHAPMREPFALCRKAFATPLGRVDADTASIDAIAAACDFDPYADQFNHKREHSLEFQVVFLRHLLGSRRIRIVPILAGLGDQQMSGESPTRTASVERFFDAVRRVVDDRRAVVVAGADLAHVGPRFGDPRALDARARRELEQVDRASLDLATGTDPEGFWEHVASDLETRRVCGLAPIYSLLRVIAPGATGRLRHYEQNVDPEEGSIVSHAALGFYA